MQRVNYPEIEHRKTERQREDAKVNNKEDQQEVEIILDYIYSAARVIEIVLQFYG